MLWWGWLLIALAVIFVVAVVGFIIWRVNRSNALKDELAAIENYPGKLDPQALLARRPTPAGPDYGAAGGAELQRREERDELRARARDIMAQPIYAGRS